MPPAAAGVPATAVAVLSSRAGNGSENSGLVAWSCQCLLPVTGRRPMNTHSRLSPVHGSRANPPYTACSSRPATSSSPSHSILVAHHKELVAPLSRIRSIRLPPTEYRLMSAPDRRTAP